MTDRGAFHGEAAVKARACADALAAEHPGWRVYATDEEKGACVERYGLTPALLNLLAVAARAPEMEGSCAFLHGALERIPPGAAPDRLVRNWMLDVWGRPDLGLEPRLRGSAAYEPAIAVIGLVERSIDVRVARDDWRRARSTLLSAMKSSAPEAGAYARVVAAMAWDMETVPAVAGDVWMAWSSAVEAVHGMAAGWEPGAQDQILESLRLCMRTAHERLGPPDAGSSEQDQRLHAAATQAEVDRLMSESGQAQRWKALQAFWSSGATAAVFEWRREALKTIQDACGARQPAAATC